MRRIKIKIFIVLLILLSLVRPAVQARAEEFELDRIIAVVNNQAITWAELYKAMEFEYAQQLSSDTGDEKRKFLKDHEGKYLDKMIDHTLELQAAAKLNITVDPLEISDAIESIKKKYSMDQDQFVQALQKEGFTLNEYRARLSDQILIGKLVSVDVRDKIKVSKAEAIAYARSQGMADDSSEYYNVYQIFIPTGENKDKAMANANAALARLKKGEDFLSVARYYSPADPDLGSLKKGTLSPEFENALDKLKPGEISKPFQTDKGIFILKLNKRIEPGDPSAYVEKARQALTTIRFEKQYKAWLISLRQSAYVDIRL